MDFGELVNGIPLILVVIGLVEFCKQLGAQGWLLTILSMAIGLVLGVLYQLSIAMPATFGGWFGSVFYGIALGLAACKLYDAGKSAAKVKAE